MMWWLIMNVSGEYEARCNVSLIKLLFQFLFSKHQWS